MLFNHLTFLVFFPTFLLLYRATRGNLRLWLTLVASNYFYACWNWHLLPLLWFQTTLDYFVGRVLARQQNPHARKLLVALSLTINLLLLGFFKYFHFGLNSLRAALSLMGIHLPDVAIQI